MILMLFYLFCMFHHYWRIIHRSQDSAGKSIVKIRYFWSSAIRGKYTEASILSDDGGSQKGRPRWATVGPPHTVARPPMLPRHHMGRRPRPTSAVAPSRTSSSRNPKTRGIIEDRQSRLLEAENTRERKALRQGEICRGNSFPEGTISLTLHICLF